MEYGYILKLSSKNLYKEIQLSPAETHMKIGMDVDCDVRLYKEDFFEKFDLSFSKTAGGWRVTCSDNVYIYAGDVRKLVTKELRHGDVFHVRYQNADMEVFRAEFLFDFDNEAKSYDCAVDISQIGAITIGGRVGCDICLNSKYTQKDAITLTRIGQTLHLRVESTDYGVYKNGNRISGEAEIHKRDFFSMGEFSFYYDGAALRTSFGEKLQLHNLAARRVSESESVLEYPRFNRSTRIKHVVPMEDIPILDPPEQLPKQKRNLILTLLPSLLTILMVVMLRGVMGQGGMAYVLMSAGMMCVGLITSVVTYITNQRDYKKESANRISKYHDYIRKKEDEITEERQKERKLLNEIYCDMPENVDAAVHFTGSLFDRGEKDSDFLRVRLGTGSVKACRKIGYKKREKFEVDDVLAGLPEQICERYRMLDDAPVVSDLRKANAVAVIGDRDVCFDMLQNMAVDIATRHYYKDVKLFFLFNEDDRENFAWIRFLPHVNNGDISMRNLAFDTNSRATLFEYLYRELSLRERMQPPFVHMVIFAFSAAEIKSHPLAKFFDKAASIGVTFVFFARSRELIPPCCREVITLDDTHVGTRVLAENADEREPFSFTPIGTETAERVVMKLAPVYCEEISLENNLTKNISLFELLHIYTVEDLNLQKRWSESAVDKSMAAPLGVKSKNEIVYLDLHEKVHGPHGLVAGTTGSGKSEILQSYILSMATLFHPYEVSFLIIDFKGGGMANQFRQLPHLVGAITNIDGREIERSLKSIKAELVKRQACFAEAGVNHIDKYIRLYKEGKVSQPIPHLIVIVDEFAELKAEQPEFMKELISASRIGRSLGVHLILATQKPSGQVNEQIWSNSRFKLCLKVQSQEDSNEVLKSPLAAEIKEPGRAYLQVGNNEIFDLFQSGYSGAMEKAGEDSNTKAYTICSLDLSGRRSVMFQQKKSAARSGARTQLEAVVDYVHVFCETHHIVQLPPICLPRLPRVLKFEAGERKSITAGVAVDLGMYDDPDQQLQAPVTWNLSDGNLFVVGAAQYGKTNVLQTLIRAVAENYTSEQVNVYILDFGSMILKNLETLHHVGGVVTAGDEERLVNLFKLLNTELSERKSRLAETGVSSFNAYLEAGFSDMPQILLMIDNMTALQQLYPDVSEDLLNLCREGITEGITVIVANSQTAGIGYKYLSSFAYRMALFCNDSGEYSNLFERSRIEPDNTPGSAIIEIGHELKLAQIYLAVEGEREIDRVHMMRAYAERINCNNPVVVRPIPMVPEIITLDGLSAAGSGIADAAYCIPYGMNYANMDVEYLNLTQLGVMGITGREHAGKTNFVFHLLNALQRDIFRSISIVQIVDDANKRLEAAQEFGCVQTYTNNLTDAKALIASAYQTLMERKAKIVHGEMSPAELVEEPLLVLILSGQDVIDELIQNSKIQDMLVGIAKDLKKYKSLVVVSGFENAKLPALAPSFMKYIRDSKNLVVFDDMANINIIDVPVRFLREYTKEIQPGDAYTFFSGKVRKVKTILYKGGR